MKYKLKEGIQIREEGDGFIINLRSRYPFFLNNDGISILKILPSSLNEIENFLYQRNINYDLDEVSDFLQKLVFLGYVETVST